MVANVDWFFISHRLCIAQEAKKKGWEVFVEKNHQAVKGPIKNRGKIQSRYLRFFLTGNSVLSR